MQKLIKRYLRFVWMATVTALVSGAPLTALSQHRSPKRGLTPTKAPDSCALALVQTQAVTGTLSYIRLRYVIESLSSAQESITNMNTSMKDFDSATNPTMGMAALLTGTAQAEDALHCAAALMEQYPATDDGDKQIKFILASSFNTEADAVGDLMAHLKQQFVRPAKDETSATKLRDAERIASITATQNKAATDILQTTTYALLKSVDLSDKTAKTTEYLAVSCDEFADLVKRNVDLARADKSAYSTPATFIQKVLDGHKCRPS